MSHFGERLHGTGLPESHTNRSPFTKVPRLLPECEKNATASLPGSVDLDPQVSYQGWWEWRFLLLLANIKVVVVDQRLGVRPLGAVVLSKLCYEFDRPDVSVGLKSWSFFFSWGSSSMYK